MGDLSLRETGGSQLPILGDKDGIVVTVEIESQVALDHNEGNCPMSSMSITLQIAPEISRYRLAFAASTAAPHNNRCLI